MDPLRTLGRKPSSWDQAVNVRMMKQVLTPGMQDGKESNLCSEVTRITSYLLQGLGTGAEQEVIEDLLVL
jgi:hypothetical protein